jgi:hypothetical protein
VYFQYFIGTASGVEHFTELHEFTLSPTMKFEMLSTPQAWT